MQEHYHRPINEKNKKIHKKSNLFKQAFFWLFSIFLSLFLIGAALFIFFAAGAPKLTQAKLESVKSSVIYDSNDKAIYTAGVEDRTYIPIEKVSKLYINALISVEDRRFYQDHLGIDPLRIAVAGFKNVAGGNISSGASTLTQQLIKLSFFSTNSNDRTLRRKAQEAWLAMQLEQNYTKNQILEYYINKIYLGNGVYGIETASKYYFNKSSKDLTLDEAASLAGLSNLPTDYEPYLHPQSFITRRNTVLKAMLDNDTISSNDYNQAVKANTLSDLVSKSDNDKKRSINMAIDPFVKETLSEVRKLGYDPFSDGLKIYTSLNSDVQNKAYDLVNNDQNISFPDDNLQVGFSIIDPTNGQVIAQIGGRKTENIQFGLNRAVQNTRSVGSTIKPLLDYAPAIEFLKYSTFQKMSDEPFDYPGTNIAINNWDNKYFGTISLRYALATSRNIPAVKTLQAVGISSAVNFVKNLGLNIPTKDQVYSEAISGNFSSLDMAAAYGALANNGTYYKPSYIRKITTPDGNTTNYHAKAIEAMFPSTAYMITDVLKDSFKYGNGLSGATPNIYDAAKTGSTNYSQEEIEKNPALGGVGIAKDNWFNGYSSDYSISIWTGYDNPQKNGLNYNKQEIAGKLYKDLMEYLYQDKSSKDWKQPSNVETVNVLPGVYPAVAVSNGGIRELFLSGTAPTLKRTYSSNKNNTNKYSGYNSNRFESSNSTSTYSNSSSRSSNTDTSSSNQDSSSSMSSNSQTSNNTSSQQNGNNDLDNNQNNDQ